jgi:tetratricopeptide (TPR) repeat protein
MKHTFTNSAFYLFLLLAVLGVNSTLSAQIRSEKELEGPEDYLTQAMLQQAHGDTLRALEILQKGSVKFPGNVEINAPLGTTLLALKRYKDALPVVEYVYNREPGKIDNMLVLGSTYEKMAAVEPKEAKKHQARAMSMYEQALQKDPNNFIANFNMGIIIYNKAAVYDIDPRQRDVAKLINDKLPDLREDIFTKALPYIEKAYEIDSEHIKTMVALEVMYKALKMEEKYYYLKMRLDRLQAHGQEQAPIANPE